MYSCTCKYPFCVYVQGALKGPKQATRLGMLPVKEPDGMRPANVIAKEGHEFFEADTAEKLYGEKGGRCGLTGV